MNKKITEGTICSWENLTIVDDPIDHFFRKYNSEQEYSPHSYDPDLDYSPKQDYCLINQSYQQTQISSVDLSEFLYFNCVTNTKQQYSDSNFTNFSSSVLFPETFPIKDKYDTQTTQVNSDLQEQENCKFMEEPTENEQLLGNSQLQMLRAKPISENPELYNNSHLNIPKETNEKPQQNLNKKNSKSNVRIVMPNTSPSQGPISYYKSPSSIHISRALESNENSNRNSATQSGKDSSPKLNRRGADQRRKFNWKQLQFLNGEFKYDCTLKRKYLRQDRLVEIINDLNSTEYQIKNPYKRREIMKWWMNKQTQLKRITQTSDVFVLIN